MQNQIPKNWQKVKLGEIASIVTDFVANGSFASLRENVKYDRNPNYAVLVRTKDLQEDFKNDLIYVDRNAYEFLAKTKLYGGEIILSNVGNVGQVFICPKLSQPMTLGPNSVLLKTKANDRFYYYYFKSPLGQHKLDSLISGSSQPKFNKTHFRELEIEVPEIREQDKIASILSAFDDKIELNNKIAKTLEEMAQALFKEWFVHFRFPGYEGAEFVDSELGKIPRGWKVKKLCEIASFDRGVSYGAAGLNKNGLPMINLGCFLRGGKFSYDNLKFYSGNYRQNNLVAPGDIVIANTDITQEREIIGNPEIVSEFRGSDKFLFTHHVFAMRNNSEYSNYFFYYLLKAASFRGRAAGFATGTNVLALPKDALLELLIVLPPHRFASQFTEFAKVVKAKNTAFREENQKLAALRDLLLPKLMKGEIKV